MPSTDTCVHYSICGDYSIEKQFPDFFDTHPHADTGGHWEYCIKCGRAKYFPPPGATLLPTKLQKLAESEKVEIEPGYISVEEAARILGVKENTIRGYLRQHKLSGRQVPRGERMIWQIDAISISEVTHGATDSHTGHD